MKLTSLENILKSKINNLTGNWVSKNSSYDSSISEILGFCHETNRYWDAKFNDFFIEYKKGKSIWLDLVRYSEILNQSNNNSSIETLTLFFIPNLEKDSIEEIICVETSKLISKLGINKADAELLISLNDKMPRSLNAQASLTVNDVRKLMNFNVTK